MAPAAHHVDRRLGIGWVVRQAASSAVVAVSLLLVVQLVVLLRVEQGLTRAARAAAIEATLPRASRASVGEVVALRLDEANFATHQASVQLVRNGLPHRGRLRCQPGDLLAVTVSVPAESATPAWLARLVGWAGPEYVRGRAEQHWQAD